MKRCSSSEHARRVNAALVLIGKGRRPANAAVELAARYGISRRQAYRYVREAGIIGEKVPIPEPKVTFTVKLSETLIRTLRHRARSTGQSLSAVVTLALEAFLHKGRGHGPKGKP